MLCNNCGQENSSETVFCSNCGHHLSQSQNPLHARSVIAQTSPSSIQSPPPLTAVNISKNAQNPSPASSEKADVLLAAFVGDKYDSYYRVKWFKDSEPSLTPDKESFNMQSLNIAGFLLGTSWLCYRKMYLVTLFIVLGINGVDLVLMHLLGMETYNAIGQTSFFIGWAVLTGVLGNYFYFNHSVKNIEKVINDTADPVVVEQELSKKGGASWVSAIVGTILVVLLSIVISYLFAPSWYWLE